MGRHFEHDGESHRKPPPPIFNTMVDAIVCKWLRQVLSAGDMTAIIGEEIPLFVAALFYADNGIVQSRCPVVLRLLLDTLISLSSALVFGPTSKKRRQWYASRADFHVPDTRSV